MLESLGDSGIPGGFGGPVAAEITLTGKLRVQQGGRDGVLEIKAVLRSDWHVYAIDQQGGPGPAKITVKPSDQFEVRGSFQADRPPQVRTTKEFDVPLREHDGEVTWAGPVRLAAGVYSQQVRPEVVFDGLLCRDKVGCKPVFGERVEIALGGYYPYRLPRTLARRFLACSGPDTAARGTAGYRAECSHATLGGHLEAQRGGTRRQAQAGADGGQRCGLARVCLRAADSELVAKPTLIVLSEPADSTQRSRGVGGAGGAATGRRRARGTLSHGPSALDDGIAVLRDMAPGKLRLAGIVGYQTCTDGGLRRTAGRAVRRGLHRSAAA